jgi:hypothetical protein
MTIPSVYVNEPYDVRQDSTDDSRKPDKRLCGCYEFPSLPKTRITAVTQKNGLLPRSEL